MSSGVILAIESSCDETAVALVRRGREQLVSLVSSQIALHAPFGGVVPEVASRAHVELITPMISDALEQAQIEPAQLDAIAATAGPGLIGALLVGVAAAKALAYSWNKPYVAVNHLEAHAYASFLENPALEPPLLVLLVSGGHTQLVVMRGHGNYELLGATIDDAAGEAFDKVARFCGLGYPGGPVIDRLANDGDPTAVRFPRALRGEGFDFSFSGLKTAVITHVRKNPEMSMADVAASFQAAVVDVLVEKAIAAAQSAGVNRVVLTGGVAANSGLRTGLAAAGRAAGLDVYLPSRAMCTDNAAMVGAAAWWVLQREGPTQLSGGANPNWRFPS